MTQGHDPEADRSEEDGDQEPEFDSLREAAIERERMRRPWGGAWPWLFPATFLLHIGEELGAGDAYPSWAEVFPGLSLDPAWYMLVNGVLLLLMVLGAELASRSRRFRWVGLALAVLVTVNGLFEAVSSVVATSYSPGLASGVLLWIPLGLATLARARRSVDWQDYARGFAVGVGVHALLTLAAWSLAN